MMHVKGIPDGIYRINYLEIAGVAMHFIPQQDRYQMTFMSSLNDLVSPDHPVRIIDAIVDSILSASPEKFEYKGQRQICRRA